MGKRLGELDFKDRSISPKYRISDWKRASQGGAVDWKLATNIFKDRLHGRFLKPVEHISQDYEIWEFSGFTILAIDCLIIETLNQFYNGIDETVGEHRKAFWDFFKNSKHFRTNFSRKKAYIFYSHFRCGILHQAQTKYHSVVRIDEDRMIAPVNPQCIAEGLIVDRELFHEALKREIEDYIQKLLSGDEVHNKLRENFVKKMNFICGPTYNNT